MSISDGSHTGFQKPLKFQILLKTNESGKRFNGYNRLHFDFQAREIIYVPFQTVENISGVNPGFN